MTKEAIATHYGFSRSWISVMKYSSLPKYEYIMKFDNDMATSFRLAEKHIQDTLDYIQDLYYNSTPKHFGKLVRNSGIVPKGCSSANISSFVDSVFRLAATPLSRGITFIYRIDKFKKYLEENIND